MENYLTENLENKSKFYYNEDLSFFCDNVIKRAEFINIEDLLILEEKFSDVLISVKRNNNTPNE